MTNEEMLGVAEIVERATNRFNEQAARFRERSAAYDRLITDMNADHERKMAEHRASFGARTEADRQIIEGLRAQVQDQRAEIERIKLACDTYAADWDTAGKACRIRVDEYPLSSVIRLVRDDAERAAVAKRLVEERDALRAEVTDLRGIFDMVHASLGIKPGDHIGRAVEALKKLSPKYTEPNPKYEPEDRPNVPPVMMTDEQYIDWLLACERCMTARAMARNTQSDTASPSLKARYADHDTPAGKEAAEAVIRNSQVTEIKAGTTLRLCKAPKPEPQLSGLVEFPWNEEWGSVGDVAEVINTLDPASIPAVAVRLESGLVVWWPRSCIEIVRKVPQ